MSITIPSLINRYHKDGYVSPIDILSLEDVEKIIEEIHYIEKKWPNEINGLGRNNIHYISPAFDQIVHNSKLLNYIESIIGKNILVAGSVLFIKEPDKKGFVSWHQDGKYQGFHPYNYVTAWIALTNVNEENGCMWMWPGSHKKDILEHKDTFHKNNLLTRGQTIKNVPEEETVPIKLEPGQLSLHHPLTVHSSGLNRTNNKRIGFVIQSYIGTNVEQIIGKTYVQQAKGKDQFKFHKHTKRPNKKMNEENLILRNKANKELQKILYKDAKKIGKY